VCVCKRERAVFVRERGLYPGEIVLAVEQAQCVCERERERESERERGNHTPVRLYLPLSKPSVRERERVSVCERESARERGLYPGEVVLAIEQADVDQVADVRGLHARPLRRRERGREIVCVSV